MGFPMFDKKKKIVEQQTTTATDIVSPSVNAESLQQQKDYERVKAELDELKSRLKPVEKEMDLPAPLTPKETQDNIDMKTLTDCAEYYTRMYSTSVNAQPDMNKSIELSLLFAIFSEIKQLRDDLKR